MKQGVVAWLCAVIAAGVAVAADTNRGNNMASKVRREDGKVWLDGVKGFSPADCRSSVHGAQARILQAVGETMTYDDLVCYGGFAFRVGIDNRLCPSAGHPCCGYMCIENSNKAIPWRTKIYESFPGRTERNAGEGKAFRAEVCAAIKTSLDRGIPVNYVAEEEGLIIGYADEGRRWWCVHPYHKRGGEPFWYDEAAGFAGGRDKWPWGVVVWLEPKLASERADERKLTLAALRQAVDMWYRKDKIEGHYLSGDAAYAFWLQYLRDVEAGKVKDPKACMQGSGWCYDVLTQNRPIASRWLKVKAALFKGEARERLLAAAEEYGKIGDILMEGAGCPWSLVPQSKESDETNSERRQKQIARLERVRRL